MQWSKLKTKMEGFISEKLKERMQIHITAYRKFHDSPRRIWITFDKEVIVSASDTNYWILHEKIYEEIKFEQRLKPIPYEADWWKMYESEERQELVRASEEAEQSLLTANIMDSGYVYQSFLDYCSLSIDHALHSENEFIRAFAMFDRRIGKRRLSNIDRKTLNHPLISKFYQIRCQVEKMAKR
ncbi:SF0329 family protein [Niallia circulans]|uniref:SF0329 family protein n=1 Tax=Niallia circulans TaxID=1397 RepID=UPI003523A670